MKPERLSTARSAGDAYPSRVRFPVRQSNRRSERGGGFCVSGRFFVPGSTSRDSAASLDVSGGCAPFCSVSSCLLFSSSSEILMFRRLGLVWFSRRDRDVAAFLDRLPVRSPGFACEPASSVPLSVSLYSKGPFFPLGCKGAPKANRPAFAG